jgi:hypothetical protein
VFQFSLLVANFWDERCLQNHCPLVAKFGIRLANLLWGSDFAYVSHNGGGGILCIFLLLRAIFLFIEIFSVAKDRER